MTAPSDGQMLPDRVQPDSLPAVLLLEEDRLTSWSLRNFLGRFLEVIHCGSLGEALDQLQHPRLEFIICGAPIVDVDPGALQQLAANPRHTVIALVSDVTQGIPESVAVVEKPFALEQLAELLQFRGPTDRR